MEPMKLLLGMQQLLMNIAPKGLTPEASARVTAGLGLIEETLEYLSSTGWKPWRPNPLSREAQLEELTDILFYYMELILLSGIDWYEIMEEYKRKHQENLQRYEKAKVGDYSWDHRSERKEL